MKTNFLIVFVSVMFIAAISCKSKSQKDAEDYMSKIEKTMKENPVKTNEQQKRNAGTFKIPQGMENIVGDWELIKMISDKNDNKKADPEEEKDAMTNFKDILKFNADGSCQFTTGLIDARYEIVTLSDGRNKLVMYDKSGSEINKARYILSVTTHDLVLNKVSGGSILEVYKRL